MLSDGMKTVYRFLALGLLLIAANSSFTHRKGLQLPQSSVLHAAQCGYYSDPILLYNNGTIAVWDHAQINTTGLNFHNIACFRSSEEVDEKFRYVAFYTFGAKLNTTSYPTILYRNKDTYLEPVAWNPFATTDQIMGITISASVIAVSLQTVASQEVRIYDINTLTQLHSHTFNPSQNYFIDAFGRFIVYNPVSQSITVYYGANYMNSQTAQLIYDNNYKLVKIQDIGVYSPNNNIISKYIFVYHIADQSFAERTVEIKNQNGMYNLQKEDEESKVGDSLSIIVSNFTYFNTNNVFNRIYCDDRVFELDGQSQCIKQDGSCIIKALPKNAICVKEHSSSSGYWNRVKFVLDFDGNGKERVEIYQEVKVAATVTIVLLSLLLALIIFGLVFLYFRKTKGVTFKEFITCAYCRNKVVPKENYEKMDNTN